MARIVDPNSNPNFSMPEISAAVRAGKALQESLDAQVKALQPALAFDTQVAKAIVAVERTALQDMMSSAAAATKPLLDTMAHVQEQRRRWMEDHLGPFHQFAQHVRNTQKSFEHSLALIRETQKLYVLAPAFERMVESAKLASYTLAADFESAASARLTAAVSAMQFITPDVGVLAQLDFARSTASAIVWSEKENLERALRPTHADIWMPTVEMRREQADLVVVEVRVECYRCGGPILAEGTTLEAPVGSELKALLRVAPFCTTCLDNWDGSAEYLFPLSTQDIVPKLTVLPGEKQGDGKPAARLRVVMREDEIDRE